MTEAELLEHRKRIAMRLNNYLMSMVVDVSQFGTLENYRQCLVAACIDNACAMFLSDVKGKTSPEWKATGARRLMAAVFETMRNERDRLIAEGN